MDKFNLNLTLEAWKYGVFVLSLLCKMIDMETTLMSMKPLRIIVQLITIASLGFLTMMAYQLISVFYLITQLIDYIIK